VNFSLVFFRSITQKQMSPKYSNLTKKMTFGYSRSDVVLEFQSHRLGLGSGLGLGSTFNAKKFCTVDF